MQNSNFTFKTDLESFLTNFFNVSIYIDLIESPLFSDPLTFFNLFWQSHSIILLNKANPLKVLNYLLNLGLEPRQLHYLLENLLIYFNRFHCPDFCDDGKDVELQICLELITLEYKKLSQSLYNDNEIQTRLFNFSIIKHRTSLISNNLDKLKYLISVKTDYLEYVNNTNKCVNSTFDVLCELEIKKIRKIIKLNSYSIPVITESSLSDSHSQDTALTVQSPSLSPHSDALNKAVYRQGTALSQLSPCRKGSDLSLQPMQPQPDQIKKFIADEICAVDTRQWNYIFINKNDFTTFLSILSEFFSGHEIPPKFDMILQQRCKTRFCAVLRSVYKHFRELPLKRDDEFISLLQNLSVFKNLSRAKIYHDIVRF